ncbi:MAG: homoserine dehydrogenase [Clostridiales bacterium]|nr:homoserine dehydrogenase [Candidatus Crickella equi]
MKVGIMGFGTVGCGAYKIAKNTKGIEIVKIFSRRLRPEYEPMLVEDGKIGLFTTNPEKIWEDERIDCVIECMGGVEPARTYVLACLNAGKHVVTPNKNLISACYDELMCVANENGVQLKYTATAGGGIPWLYNLSRTTRCDDILEVRGIVNGTCNYILDAMHTDGVDYDDILKTAQELGYAEANPAADVEGTDTLRKTVISANIAFSTVISEESVPCAGIDGITAKDIKWFNDRGYTCKLMMNVKKVGDNRIAAYVEPTLFGPDSLEANVKTNNNLITLVGESIGTQSFYGQGAGMLPTGESVIQDCIDILEGGPQHHIYTSLPMIVDNNAEEHRYYVRTADSQGITKPTSVLEMHHLASAIKEGGVDIFFAAIK